MLEEAEQGPPTPPQGPGESYADNMKSDRGLEQEQICRMPGRERIMFSANSTSQGGEAQPSSALRREQSERGK